ncbi:hypothetical protein FZEAL_5571 [Fusarium zealandicum]|uniref:Uncharacterized protein n=1 Tax=Fusarium zealandicum TaxID=1053134 RepID=A0A8H4UJI1_9HYPO|nr:hypothetical protein FZEAL_5571 [Fusarium zealandicum]
MPFDFQAYDQKCNGLTMEELQQEWEHYTRLISGAATSTAVSGMAIPLTLGVSTIGVAMAAPAIHNARKKREIIEKHLNKLNATHNTRKRDVLGSMAVSGTIGVVTLGIGSMGADAVATAGAEHGIQSVIANETAIKVVTHAAFDGAGMAVEHAHRDHLKKKNALKAFQKAGVFKAVQDAKAAEAGYSAHPYNSQPYSQYAGSSSYQALPMPPPPYTTAIPQTPSQPAYPPSLSAYPQDFKASMTHAPVPHQGQPYTTPDTNSQQSVPQYHGYPQQQILYPQQIFASPGVSSIAPVNNQVYSPPQTPIAQTQQGVHYTMSSGPQPFTQNKRQPAPLAHSPPYTPDASHQTYNMSAMSEALPVWTPVTTPYQQTQGHRATETALPASEHEKAQAYSYTPAQTGFFDQATQAFPTGYSQSASPFSQSAVEPVSQLPDEAYTSPAKPTDAAHVYQEHAVQHSTGPQRLPAQGFQPQHHQHSAYQTPQQTGLYQQTEVISSPQRESIINTPQQPFSPQPSYNPQQYAPVSHRDQIHAYSTYTAMPTPAQIPQSVQTPMQYQASSLPQTAMGGSVFQYQSVSTGRCLSGLPPANSYASGATWQNMQPAHVPQHCLQPSYPPVPVPLPYSPPSAQ